MELPEPETRARFRAARVARLATVDAEGRPYLVPCTFAAHGDVIVSAVDHKPKRTTRLARLANIQATGRACFLVDEYVDDWTKLWWARADCAARTVTDGSSAESAAARAWLAEKYPQYADLPPQGPVIWAEVLRWRGWTATALRPPDVPPPGGG